MVPHIFPWHFFTINIFTNFFIISALNCCAKEYENCSSLLSCGNVTNIGYPFWGAKRPQYCGHPMLKLQCPDSNHSNDHPVLQIIDTDSDTNLSFEVLGISNNTSSYRTIKLVEVPSDSPCSSDIFNNHVFKEVLNFTTNVTIIKLFHDLPKNLTTNRNNSVNCSGGTYGRFPAYYLRNMSDSHITDDHRLKQYPSLDIPVLKEELIKLERKKEILKEVMKKGFEVALNDEFTKKCFICENSGGACGSSISSGQFVCYCKDQHSCDTECQKSGKWKLKLILGLAIPGCICFLTATSVALLCYKKKLKFQLSASQSKTFSYYHSNSDAETGNTIFGIPVFSCDELKEATNNFDSVKELGDGGFGVVYHGKLRDGREVAVKRLYEKTKSYKGGQFMNEIMILTKLRHQNLVTLYGCTSCHSQDLLLVYEFVPNGTVADHLYGNRSKSGTRTWTLPWSFRMRIAIQTASALSYLHASDIIHRDVKTNNILLNNDFTVKVADFGLSRLIPIDVTHVSTAPQGTPGYLDPEYNKCYQLTNKSDVYSFGVVLIELISSLPAIDINRKKNEINLSDYAMHRIQNGELEALVDRQLGYETDLKVKKMTTLVGELAFRCLQQEKEVRPSMEEVFEALKQIESVDCEALESEEKGWHSDVVKPTSQLVEDEGDHHQTYPVSPISVIQNWDSRSSVASDPSSKRLSKVLL